MPATQGTLLVIDAGIEHLRLRISAAGGAVLSDHVVPNHGDLRALCASLEVEGWAANDAARVIITGKLAATAHAVLGGGQIVPPAAAFWLAAQRLIARDEEVHVRELALVDLSASGYLLVGVDREGRLAHDLLVVNPRCGAGSGINLDRVLQKLAIPRDRVDDLLTAYMGESGARRRAELGTRADRCGVFASSATVSDKNQGIPLDVALATTLKSEVLKACRKLPAGVDKVYFCGRVFRWRFARDCAEDFVRGQGAREVAWDPENTYVLDALAARPVEWTRTRHDVRKIRDDAVREFAGFAEIKRRHEASGHYLRLPAEPVNTPSADAVMARTVFIGLDVGSTMAKAVISDADTGEMLSLSAHSNAGDTIETVKRVFRDLIAAGVTTLRVRGIGITGSARYQVQEALARLLPAVADRLIVLVENYAHARGSIDEARRHVARLVDRGVAVNRNLCVLVDIGGEDTKISTIALAQAELFANAMNLKCSAGTGSLMDTLAALFDIRSVADACAEAFAAPKSSAINATCAVFLMENARRLQAEGVPRDQILASANWAIVENMARTLWAQIEIPSDAVVLLHGQTMLSEPLPLAVTDRLQSYLNAPAYAVVPPHPGHRACLGLVRTMSQTSPSGYAEIHLDDFVDARFAKRIILCRGAACGDADARCNRASLACQGADGSRITFTLGGCTAINELFARRGAPRSRPPRDAYKEIWEFIASREPHSDDPGRLVIPRSFCVTEWAYLFGRIFERLGIPVHVDEVRGSDLLNAQEFFHVDTCAPQMGAVGQFRRLAAEPHGIILAPQIENLPMEGRALGLTCTVNQGGVAVACNLASCVHPNARFHMFTVRLRHLEAQALADQLAGSLRNVFAYYGVTPSAAELVGAVESALDDHRRLRQAAADLAADLAEEAQAEGRPIAVVVGREYVLNPGIYDSSVRRLLHDKHITAIPSYVLDVHPNPEFDRLYWRNPNTIVTLLEAIAEKTLHRRVKHPRLAAVFAAIEDRTPEGPLLPVVQVSTFSCGPDSVTSHVVAEIMRRRPFLLLQSDAVLKELAHLENRVNTYMKQLELGLRATGTRDDEPLEIRRIAAPFNTEPLDREHDVIYLPTMGDNRVVTSVLRAAGLTCIDTYDEQRTLATAVREGRRYTGDAVCAPLAAVYGDLLLAVQDFKRRRERGDALVRGKRRLLYFDNQGDGPCRQGQYAELHAFLAGTTREAKGSTCSAPATALPGGAVLQMLIGHEDQGFNIGVEEWTLYRAYQGTIAQAVLADLLFAGGARCTDENQYERFLDEYRQLKALVHGALESFHGPGSFTRGAMAAVRGAPGGGALIKYFAYRMHGRDLTRPISDFARRWIRGRTLPEGCLRIHVSGEVYMRIAQAEDLFRALLQIVGFRRFSLTSSHLWPYVEYLPQSRIECSREAIASHRARRERAGTRRERRACEQAIRVERMQCRRARIASFVLRHVLARPLYRAAGLPLPPGARELLETAREILPSLRPHGELAVYIGEALRELRHGVDLLLSIAPVGCMVTSMGEVLTPRILQIAGASRGRIQSLFSSDGDLNEELLELALLKVLGPERF